MSGMDNISLTVRTYRGGAGEDFMLPSDSVVVYENSGLVGAYLPPPIRGRHIRVVNATSSGLNVISRSQLDGVPGASINVVDWAHFLCDGVNWFTLGSL